MRTCEVVENDVKCGKKQYCRGMCPKHYHRWRRYGDPLLLKQKRTCSFDGCENKHCARGFCSGHYQQRKRGEELKPLVGDPNTPVGYNGAHWRVDKAKGKASAQDCVDCGQQAEHWSYNHKDPNELSEQKPFREGVYGDVTYSIHPDYYEPRCVPCHHAFDLNRKGVNV